MDHTGLVSGFERIGNLSRDREHFFDQNRAFRDALGQRGTFHELEYECFDTVGVFDAVYGCDVRMIQ